MGFQSFSFFKNEKPNLIFFDLKIKLFSSIAFNPYMHSISTYAVLKLSPLRKRSLNLSKN